MIVGGSSGAVHESRYGRHLYFDPQKFVKISHRKYFFEPWSEVLNIWCDPMYSGADAVESQLIRNGITIFFVEYSPKTNKLVRMGHQLFSSDTIKEKLPDFLSGLKKTETYLYLMGSIDKPAQEEELKSIIDPAIGSYFGRDCIVQKEINIKENSGFDFLSAIMRKDGELYYCFHE